MNDFQTELLKTLKGIQRELVIMNAPDKINVLEPESPKQKQKRLFMLEDILEVYGSQLNHDNPTIKEEATTKFKETMKYFNELSSQGARQI